MLDEAAYNMIRTAIFFIAPILLLLAVIDIAKNASRTKARLAVTSVILVSLFALALYDQELALDMVLFLMVLGLPCVLLVMLIKGITTVRLLISGNRNRTK